MEQQFSLSWNNFHGNLSRGFAGLLGKGEFVDVSLAVEGHILQAHKVVLSICSPYFKKMFQTNPCQHPIVVLRDVTHKAMKDLLQFMYHGEVSVKQEDLTSFIGTAEVLQIKGLTNKEMDDEQEEEEVPKQVSPPITNNIATAPRQSLDNLNSEDLIPNEQIDLQRQLMERLNKLSALKRKSDEYMKSNFNLNSLPQQYVVMEKRPKLREKQILNRHNIAARRNSFEVKKNNVFDEVPTNMSTYVDQMSTVSVPQENHRLALDSHDYNDNKNVLPSPDQQLMKVEFEDGSELTMADMAQSDSSKLSEANEPSMDHQNVREVLMTPPIQEDGTSCDSLSTADAIKSDVLALNGNPETYRRCRRILQAEKKIYEEIGGHKITTIPQKEDGKKKYPQRSCRSCWKGGKRRDTRFMCNTCEIPFCKTPCFEIHLSTVCTLKKEEK